MTECVELDGCCQTHSPCFKAHGMKGSCQGWPCPVGEAEMIDNLPLTQYLVMDLLAGRFRTGEKVWTLPTRAKATVKKLEALGLVGWKSGIVDRTILVWLTETGKSSVLDPNYVPPIEKKSAP